MRIKLLSSALLAMLTLLLPSKIKSQKIQAKDTANYPYWIEMMQDRSINFYRTQSAFNTYWENRDIEKGSGWKQFKRWEWMAQQIVDEQGNFPNEYKQIEDYQKIIEQNSSNGLGLLSGAPCFTQGNWKELGPVFLPKNNTGQMNGMGRLNAVALHPTDTNTFYVGACAGGFWKTHDAGNTWQVYRDSLATLGVSSIALNPNHPDTMYFGSGDRDASDALGFGVYKSVDGGNTWVISNSNMGNVTVGRLIVDPKNPNILLAASSNGIYRSTNAAATWTRVNSNTNFKDIAFMPNNSNVVYATRVGLFYKSTDNGITWTQISSGIPTTGISRGVISVSPLDSTLVYFWLANGSVHQGFYLSRNGGTSFQLMSTTPNIHANSIDGSGTSGQAWYDKTMTVDPTNAGIIYCGGVNIFKSQDTGKTWAQAGYWVNQVHADHHDMVSCPITKRIFVANDGGLYFSRTKGTPWIPVKSGLAIAQIYKMGASRTQKDIIITGFQDNGTANYNNGWFTTRGGDGMDCAVDQEDPRYSYGEVYYGDIYRVFNVNSQGTIARNGYIAAGSDTINESGAWVTPFKLREGNSSTMYIGYKNIWRSTNVKSSPVTWKKISNNLGGVNNSDFHELENCIANSNILYASRSNNTFFRSDNINDVSPTFTTLTQPVSGLVRAIETDPKNENIVYISISNRVYKSLNKGGTWTTVNGTLPFNVLSILLDTSSAKKGLYVGTFGSGVWYTDSTLSTWKYFNNGIPPTSRVTDLEMYYDTAKDCNCNRIYASTYNRGTWYGNVYVDSLKKPIAKLEEYSKIIPCVNTEIQFKNNSCNIPSEFKWKFFGSGIQYTNGTDSTSESPFVKFQNVGNYTFYMLAANCQGADTLWGSVQVLDTLKPVCKTGLRNLGNFGIGIFEIQLAGKTIINGGTAQEGPYVDNTCQTTFVLEKGKNYPMYVRTGTSNDEQVKVFIDLNNDGSFNNSNEVVFDALRARTNHFDTFSIPFSAKSGVPLRMRVKSDFIAVSTNACDSVSYGQSEDYTVYIPVDSVYTNFSVNKTSICAGNSVIFTDSTTHKIGSYVWNFGSGASPSSAFTPGPHVVTYSTPGYKNVTLSVNNEIKRKDSFVLVNVTPNVSITQSVSNTNICLNTGFSFSAVDSTQSGASFSWYKNNQVINDSTRNFYVRNNATVSDSGSYFLVANNSGCRDTSNSIILNIRPKPSVSFTVNDTAQCLSGNDFSFSRSSTIPNNTGNSSSIANNIWKFDNATVYGNTASIQHSFSTPKIYSIKLINSTNFGCSDSASRNILVHPQPSVSFTINDTAQCLSGNDFSFNRSTTIPNNTGNSSSIANNIWKFDNATVYGNTANIQHSFSTPKIYSIKLINSTNFGCSDSASRNILVHPQPSVSFTVNDTAQCLSGNDFSFSRSSTIPNNTGNSSSIANNIWKFDNATVYGNTASIQHSFSTAKIYSIKLINSTNFGCSDSASRNILVHPQPSVSFTINDTAQCLSGNDFSFSRSSTIPNNTGNTSSITNNIWKFDNTTVYGNTASIQHSFSTPKIYSVKLTNSTNFGCSDSASRNILVHPQPDFNVDYTDSVCLNDTALLTANSADINTVFVWKYDGMNFTTKNLSIKAEQIGQMEIKLLANTQNNCSDSANYTIQTLALPVFSLGNDTSYCSNETFNLTLKTGMPQNLHLWNTNEQTDTIVVTQAGMYSAEVKTSFGCSYTDSIQITELSAPVFDLGSDRFLNPDLPISETISAGNGFTKYQWNTGDSSSFINVSDTGRYSVIVQNIDGCKESDTLFVKYWNKTTNINNVWLERNQIKVYPNPSNNYITIESNTDVIGKIRIYSNIGQLMYDNNIDTKLITIDNIDWASGIYIVETTQNGLVSRNRINIVR